MIHSRVMPWEEGSQPDGFAPLMYERTEPRPRSRSVVRDESFWAAARAAGQHLREGVVVVLVADGIEPGCVVAMFVDFEYGYVDHKSIGGRAVPVLLAGFEEDAVTRADELEWAATALGKSNALGYKDGLAVGVGMPGGAGAWCEVDGAATDASAVGGRRDRIDVDRAGEPVAGTGSGGGGASCEFHMRPSPRGSRGCLVPVWLESGPGSFCQMRMAGAACGHPYMTCSTLGFPR